MRHHRPVTGIAHAAGLSTAHAALTQRLQYMPPPTIITSIEQMQYDNAVTVTAGYLRTSGLESTCG